MYRNMIVAMLSVLCLGLTSVNADETNKPNVLFIAVDDLRDWVGHLGHPNVKTPAMDRLARRGVSFTRAYCAAPLCNPSRISLLTGIAPSRSGVYGNGEKLREKLPDAVTLMQHFRSSGYVVQGGGKIFHGRSAYDKASWDYYFRPQGTRGRPGVQRDTNLPGSAWTPWGPLAISDEEMFDGKIAGWVVSQLKKSHSKPFFLACGFTKPHLPWYVPKKYFDMHPQQSIKLPLTVEGDLDDLPDFGKKLAREVYDPSGEKNFAVLGGDHKNVIANNQWRTAVQAYLATISFVDAQVGPVLDALDQSEHADNTIVVLWGDHGWHLGEKEHWRKHALWDVSTRTPLIISAPQGVARGQLCQRPVSLLDLYPTLIDLCGLQKREGLDGKSLLPLLKNPQGEWPHPAVMTFGFKNHAIRSERWRYIQYHDGTEELYDHHQDPHEWTNLAADLQYKEVIRQLQASLPQVNQE
jgi:arylsulfatase A-like enzyme